MPNVSETARQTLLILNHTRGWVDPHAAGLPLEALAELSRCGLAEVVTKDKEGRFRLWTRVTPAGRQECRRAA